MDLGIADAWGVIMDALFALAWFTIIALLYVMAYLVLKDGSPWDVSEPAATTELGAESVMRKP